MKKKSDKELKNKEMAFLISIYGVFPPVSGYN